MKKSDKSKSKRLAIAEMNNSLTAALVRDSEPAYDEVRSHRYYPKHVYPHNIDLVTALSRKEVFRRMLKDGVVGPDRISELLHRAIDDDAVDDMRELINSGVVDTSTIVAIIGHASRAHATRCEWLLRETLLNRVALW